MDLKKCLNGSNKESHSYYQKQMIQQIQKKKISNQSHPFPQHIK